MVLPKIKLHQFLFFLLVLFLPTQLGKHFWPDWTMVYGLRLDYLSPTLYFTDILILGILVSWLMDKFLIFNFKKYKWWLVFFVYLFLSCLLAENQPAAFYKLAKILEFSLLGFYISKNITIDKLFNCSIATAVIYSSLIAIAQFLKQGSIGGIFYWLGERSFTSGTPGIAQTVWNGELLLRSYATFSHPNVLAGFLVISLLLVIMNNRQITTVVVICPIVLGTIALFLTFSHIGWVVFGVLVVPFLFKVFKLSRIFLIAGLICLIGLIGLIWAPIQPESITYRQDLNLAAIKMWQASPLTGVGLNNFLVRLPEFYKSSGEIRWFQPAHNIFLMALAETGLIGLIGLIWFLIKTIRCLLLTANYLLLTTLIAVLILGLFDHYFYTLQQGQLLITLILGLSWQSRPAVASSDCLAKNMLK